MLQHLFNARVAAVLLFVLGLATAAAAQPGRVGGIVRDEDGEPIKGATVTADSPDLGPMQFTATTDDRGRFTIIGLRPGTWRFIAQAPGFAAEGGEMPVRAVGARNPPITFSLRRTTPGSGPLGNLSGKDLQEELASADALFNRSEWDEAIAAYRAILERTPALAIVNLQIGAASRQKKDFTAAIAAYEELLASDPSNEKAQLGIAFTNLERGDVAAAEAILVKAAGAPDAGRDVLFGLGEMKATNGEAAEAAAWFLKASAADPSWGKPLYRLGELALAGGDRATATKYLQEVIAVDPVSPESALATTALEQLKK